ncbi:MAG: hypothetical protein H3C48_16410 [Chitinophagaceae bacterium]|nr:hypothetical protein [Chitinophagaceae bacterium]
MDTQNDKSASNSEDKKFPGYPHYPKKEDIYETEKKEPLKEEASASTSGPDLDIPGSELDDKNEAIGAEDEENNYYSLGGDQHEDLEEGEDD